MTKITILILFISMINNDFILFDFSKESSTENWKIVNDGVMGGVSQATITSNVSNSIVFKGNVSLDNNGGFSSLRYNFSRKEIKSYSKVQIRLKGDGKRYQFRLKRNQSDRHAYVSYFKTTNEWQTITINLKDLYPTFRGRNLDMNSYEADYFEEIAFLIANKVNESFQLEIKSLILIK